MVLAYSILNFSPHVYRLGHGPSWSLPIILSMVWTFFSFFSKDYIWKQTSLNHGLCINNLVIMLLGLLQVIWLYMKSSSAFDIQPNWTGLIIRQTQIHVPNSWSKRKPMSLEPRKSLKMSCLFWNWLAGSLTNERKLLTVDNRNWGLSILFTG